MAELDKEYNKVIGEYGKSRMLQFLPSSDVIQSKPVGYIGKDPNTGLYYAKSKYANQTNNPCIYNKEFYIKTISPFSGEGNELEGKIDGWWQEQDFTVAHGEGLFTHYRLDR